MTWWERWAAWKWQRFRSRVWRYDLVTLDRKEYEKLLAYLVLSGSWNDGTTRRSRKAIRRALVQVTELTDLR